MKIAQAIHDAKKPFVSFEFFPPADDEGLKNFYAVADQLSQLNPLFASVTYGAGGSKQDRTLGVAGHLVESGFTVMSHLTCVNAQPSGLTTYLKKLQDTGVENILALRGDPPKGQEWKWTGAFRHSSDLVRFVGLQKPDFGIAVAAYPCPHPESDSFADDRRRTMDKLNAGAGFAVTQLFFDAREYFELVDWLREHGGTAPVVPGILPIQSFASLRRVISMCGVSIPAKLYMELEEADRNGGVEAVRKVGIDFAVEQITRLLVGGAPGIHLYTLNKADLCLQIAGEAGLA